MKIRSPLAAALLAGLGLATTASAITDEEVFRTFRFNFVNPGGRATAMGGAFIGIADDATAAAANPAGLTNLVSSELFTELRLEHADRSSIVATVRDPQGGPDPVITRSQGHPDAMLFPSFISFVKPFEHWTFGVSRQEVLNTRVQADNVFTDENSLPATTIVRATGEMEALLEHYNVSAAFSAGEKVALGLTATLARLDLESLTENEFDFGSGLEDDYATSVDDSDDDITFSAGILIHPHDRFHIGLTYRRGARFELEEDIIATGPAGNYPSAGVLADFLGNRNLGTAAGAPFGIAPSTFDDPLRFTNVFKVPDQAGIGFGWQATDKLTLAFDAVWVQYSDLEEDFVGNVNALTFPGDAFTCDFSKPRPDGSFPCDHGTAIASYEIDDEVIYHLGIEYAWMIKETTPFLVRVGAYNDPDVRIKSNFGPGGVFIADGDTFPSGDPAIHWTIGFGFLAKEKFQADFAADLSTLANTYVASIIYHF